MGGRPLAQTDVGATLLDWMLSDVPRAGGMVLARGYLERISATHPDLLTRVNEGLDRLQAENPRAAFEVLWSAGDEVRKVERLFAMVNRGGLGAEFLRGLEYGVRDRRPTVRMSCLVLSIASSAPQAGNDRAASAAVHLLYAWVRPGRQATGADRLKTHHRVREILSRALELTLAAVGREPNVRTWRTIWPP